MNEHSSTQAGPFRLILGRSSQTGAAQACSHVATPHAALPHVACPHAGWPHGVWLATAWLATAWLATEWLALELRQTGQLGRPHAISGPQGASAHGAWGDPQPPARATVGTAGAGAGAIKETVVVSCVEQDAQGAIAEAMAGTAAEPT